MNHIVTMIHPFVMEQEVCVYQNGECVKVVKCTLDDIEKTCIDLCNEFDIDIIDTKGGQLYAMKMKKHLEDKVDTKFDLKKKITVNIH